jgi:hypothetical protein
MICFCILFCACDFLLPDLSILSSVRVSVALPIFSSSFQSPVRVSVSLCSVRSCAVRHQSKLSLSSPFVFRQIRPPCRRLVFVCCFPFDICFPRQRLRFSPAWTAKDFLARFFLQLLAWSPRSTSWSLLFSLCYRRLKPCMNSLVCWFGPVFPRLILLYCFVPHCSVS